MYSVPEDHVCWTAIALYKPVINRCRLQSACKHALERTFCIVPAGSFVAWSHTGRAAVTLSCIKGSQRVQLHLTSTALEGCPHALALATRTHVTSAGSDVAVPTLFVPCESGLLLFDVLHEIAAHQAGTAPPPPHLHLMAAPDAEKHSRSRAGTVLALDASGDWALTAAGIAFHLAHIPSSTVRPVSARIACLASLAMIVMLLCHHLQPSSPSLRNLTQQVDVSKGMVAGAGKHRRTCSTHHVCSFLK